MPNTLPYGYTEQVNESAKETYTVLTGGQKAQRIFLGPWDDRQNFIESLLPGVSETEGEVTFSDPGIYPDIPNLIAVTAVSEGRGKAYCDGTDGMVRYERALITVEYEYLTGSQGLPGTTTFSNFVAISGDISTQVFTFQKEEVLAAPAGDPPPPQVPLMREVHKLLTTENFTIKILFHPNPKWDDSFNFSGSINNAPFIYPRINFTAPAQTILYHGVSYAEKAFTKGVTLWELDYKFSYRALEWNKMYDKDGTLQTIIKLNGDPLYDSVDLNTLFNTSI